MRQKNHGEGPQSASNAPQSPPQFIKEGPGWTLEWVDLPTQVKGSQAEHVKRPTTHLSLATEGAAKAVNELVSGAAVAFSRLAYPVTLIVSGLGAVWAVYQAGVYVLIWAKAQTWIVPGLVLLGVSLILTGVVHWMSRNVSFRGQGQDMHQCPSPDKGLSGTSRHSVSVKDNGITIVIINENKIEK